MNILYFDCTYGISGDMTLGALIDAGADFEELKNRLSELSVKNFSLEKKTIKRCGISAVKIDVITNHEHESHRSLKDITKIIEKSNLPKFVKENSLKAFNIIGEAESKVHNIPINDVHFHEIGSIDTIVDIVGAFICLDMLKIKSACSSEVTVGSGIVKTHHGELPVPAPATLEILKGIPFKAGDIIGEQTTPTGAAILKTIVKEFIPSPTMKIEKIGYGAGSREIPNKPNLLRVLIGEIHDSNIFKNIAVEKQTLYKISAEIDDMNPEVYTKIFEDLFKLKSLDVNLIPIIMKKNRPGHSLQILCSKENLSEIGDYIINNTSTFGFKVEESERYCIKRKFDKIKTKYGEIDIKIGFINEDEIKIKPEFDSCLKASEKASTPFNMVYMEAISEINRKFFK